MNFWEYRKSESRWLAVRLGVLATLVAWIIGQEGLSGEADPVTAVAGPGTASPIVEDSLHRSFQPVEVERSAATSEENYPNSSGPPQTGETSVVVAEWAAPREWVAASEKAIDRGVAFLLARQNPNGSWGSARNTKGLNIYAPVPGAHHAFRAAVTGLGVAALV